MNLKWEKVEIKEEKPPEATDLEHFAGVLCRNEETWYKLEGWKKTAYDLKEALDDYAGGARTPDVYFETRTGDGSGDLSVLARAMPMVSPERRPKW